MYLGVSNRTGLAYGKNPDKVQENLYKVVPKKYLKKAGSYFITSWKIYLQSKDTFM